MDLWVLKYVKAKNNTKIIFSLTSFQRGVQVLLYIFHGQSIWFVTDKVYNK